MADTDDDTHDNTKEPTRRRLVDYPRTGRRGVRRWLPSWKLVLGTLVTLGLLAAAGLAAAVTLVSVPKANDIALAQATTFYWNDGTTVLGRAGEANRTSVTLDQVPQDVQEAVMAAEDRDFYQHGGVSPIGIARAAWNNAFGDNGTQGGSTITQQYAKNAFLTQDQTMVRKARELVLSIKLESTVSKDEILIDYLNTVYYGRGAYGIEAAAQAYFDVPASELTVEQGAMLAALLQSPNGLAPEKDLGGLVERWNYVLDGMVDQGWLSANERASMKFPSVIPYSQAAYNAGPDGFLFAAAQEQLLTLGYTEDDLNLAGLDIITTFDRQKQDAAVAAVQEYDPSQEVAGLRIGLASLEPGTGKVVALYGGADYQENQFNNATQARGQGGSTFKAFGLAAGLEDGIGLDTTYSGASPMTIDGYTLENYDNQSYGTVSMLNATVNSINTPFVQMNADIGPDRTEAALIAAGIPADTPGLTGELNNILGSASPTPLEEATAFATLAARGQHVDPTMITQVRSASGELLWEWEPETDEAFSQKVVDRVTYALRQVVTSGTGMAAQSPDRPVAGKTGTSDDYMSAWFSGYTPQLAAAVMVVRNDAAGNEISLTGDGGLTTGTGGALPAQIFGSYITSAMVDMDVEYFFEPDSVYDYTAPPSPTYVPSQEPTTVAPSQEPTPSVTLTPEPTTAEPTPAPTTPTAEPTTAAPTTVPPPIVEPTVPTAAPSLQSLAPSAVQLPEEQLAPSPSG